MKHFNDFGLQDSKDNEETPFTGTPSVLIGCKQGRTNDVEITHFVFIYDLTLDCLFYVVTHHVYRLSLTKDIYKPFFTFFSQTIKSVPFVSTKQQQCIKIYKFILRYRYL
jgi:hypothetical protein